MATRTISTGGVGIDVTEFKNVSKALRKASTRMPLSLRKKLKDAGEIVAEEARHRSSEHSTTIPGSIKVTTAGATIAIKAGGPGVPMAGLYEIGNTRGSNNGYFRAPLFGDKEHWYDHKMYPFLVASAAAKADDLTAAILTVFDEALSTIVYE